LSGADALVVTAPIVAADLSKFCEGLLRAFEEDSYKENFAWIDNLTLVNGTLLIEKLNNLTIEQLRAADTSKTHMAIPENIGWEDIDAFKMAGTRSHEYDDLDLDKYLENLRSKRSEISLEKLKRGSVAVRFSRSSDWDDRWNLYHCLVSEQRLDGQLYVLIEGRWFMINESLVSEVDSFVASLPSAAATLIQSKSGETEPTYNSRLANSSSTEFLLLDARVKRPGGASSGIELCDVFTKEGEFIHVKRRSRSSTLSHLFAQGIISVSTFLADGPFRDEIRRELNLKSDASNLAGWLDLVPDASGTVERSRYSVSYVVIANSSKAENDWLPFFSKLNLMQCGRQLRNLGIKVTLSRISAP